MIPAALVTKEARALLPVFAAVVVSLLFASGAPDFLRVRLVLLGLVFGTITLGGLAFGHEYTYRTLTVLLAQPIDRRRAYAAKMLTLIPLVLLICLVAALCAPGRPMQLFGNARGETRALFVLAPLCAICLAPALSLLCRSALAAVVFTVAIPGLLMLAANVMATAIYGFYRTPAIDAFLSSFMWRSVPIACAAGAIATWMLFLRLEAIEGHSEMQLPRWLRGDAPPAAVRRNVRTPLAALVRKEIRLQQLTFVVVALYLLAYGAVALLQRAAPEFPRIPLEALSAMYVALLAILIGSLASAEERQLGTLPSQLLLPLSMRWQWAIKVATALGLVFVLGIVLPLLVAYLFATPEEQVRVPLRIAPAPLLALALLTCCGLYVSTLSTSGVRAMVNCIPVVLGLAFIAAVWAGLMFSSGAREFHRAMSSETFAVRVAMQQAAQSAVWMIYAGTGILIGGLLLRFGYVNHRTLDHGLRRPMIQAAIVLIVWAICLALPALAWSYYSTPR